MLSSADDAASVFLLLTFLRFIYVLYNLCDAFWFQVKQTSKIVSNVLDLEVG